MSLTQPTSEHNNINSPPSFPPPTTTTSPLYLIRLSQSHESFRLPELHSLSTYFNIPIQIHNYSSTSPFCVISLPSITPSTPDPTHLLAKRLISRSILAKGIYELYATAPNYADLHNTIQSLPGHTWDAYRDVSFKFSVDGYRGKRSMSEQRAIVEGFGYLPFKGRIRMSGAQEEFVVFEEWEGLDAEGHAALRAGRQVEEENVNGTMSATTTITHDDAGLTSVPPQPPLTSRSPTKIYFTRHLSPSQRHLIEKHDLKKRPYISTTSMDAELALLTGILAHVGPGRLILDPFVGTGGFMVAAAELGAVTLGSDIDGRSFRGKGKGMEKGVLRNFERYGILSGFGDCVTSDLTNTPLRIGRGKKRWLDAVICDPPYGVREGLKVLGRRRQGGDEVVSPDVNGVADGQVNAEARIPSPPPGPFLIDGVPSYTLPGFIAPKRPYSFNAMLLDILDFAARTLVTGGRLAFWMPCANEVGEEEFPVPEDPRGLVVLRHVCVQEFNRWSRRLLVYERVDGEVEDDGTEKMRVNGRGGGHHADDLNHFRRMYFQGFNRDAPSGNVGDEKG